MKQKPLPTMDVAVVSQGIFGNVLTSPRAAILGRSLKGIDVLWVDGMLAGKRTRLTPDPLLFLGTPEKIPSSDVRKIISVNKRLAVLTKRVREQKPRREDVVRYGRELRKRFPHAKVATEGFSKTDRDMITMTFPQKIPKDALPSVRARISGTLHSSGYKHPTSTYVLPSGQHIYVNFGSQKDKDELREAWEQARKVKGRR